MVGIGTEATRANIIGGQIARAKHREERSPIRASDAAFTLIDRRRARGDCRPEPPPCGNRRST